MNHDNPQPVCDLTFLRESYQGHIPMMLEVLDLFVEQLPAQVRDLEEAVGQRDFVRVEYAAHRMKSTLMIVGLTRINSELNEMEGLGEKRKTRGGFRNFLSG